MRPHSLVCQHGAEHLGAWQLDELRGAVTSTSSAAFLGKWGEEERVCEGAVYIICMGRGTEMGNWDMIPPGISPLVDSALTQ